MCYIFIFEESYYMNNRIDFTYMAQKLINKSFDITKLNSRRYYFFSFNNLCKFWKPFIRHFYNTNIWVDGTKRIIGSISHLLFQKCVKKRGLPNVRKTNDPSSKHSEKL